MKSSENDDPSKYEYHILDDEKQTIMQEISQLENAVSDLKKTLY